MTAAYYKYLIGHFLSPLSLLLTIIIICYLLIIVNRKIKLAKWTMGIALTALYLLSTKIGSDIIIAPLEFQYPKFQQTSQPIDYIVVLGCGNEFSPHLPESSKLQGCSHIRLQEGLDIHWQNPQSKLILSGGDPKAKDTLAQTMQRAALRMGVNPDNIIVLRDTINTEDEAAQTAKIVINAPQTVLVTSAAHMRRAMHLFKTKGIEPIPAPTDFLIRRVIDTWYLRYFIPDVANLDKVRSAFHEYYGIWWLKLKSWLN